MHHDLVCRVTECSPVCSLDDKNPTEQNMFKVKCKLNDWPLTSTVGVSIHSWGNALLTPRFTSLMPSGWIFIVFCVLLSMTQGVGSAMFTTAAYALLVELFPNNVSTVMVCLLPVFHHMYV